MNYTTRTWSEIDLDLLKQNIINIKSRVKNDTKIIAVVKANSYGHGAVMCSKTLLDNGADILAVACIDEALELRKFFKKTPILLLGTSNQLRFEDIVLNDVTASLCDTDDAIRLSEVAASHGKTAKIHIKIDSGMGRLGFLADEPDFAETVEEILKIGNLKNIEIEGIFTHFSVSDTEYKYTLVQFNRFKKLCDTLEEKGLKIKIRHCANSAATILYPEFHLDAVRPGIILYGYHPSPATFGKISLSPIMSIKSRITHIKTLSSGNYVSYGNEYKTDSDQKIATIPIGYADGFLRGNFGKANVLFNGKFLPVVGRICMDQCMFDATSVNNINVGDVVTVLGCDNGKSITADDLAKNLHTINYEILCGITNRVCRIYFQDGKQISDLAKA